jgi:hypothetical protein
LIELQERNSSFADRNVGGGGVKPVGIFLLFGRLHLLL